jgi:hypothetical protein
MEYNSEAWLGYDCRFQQNAVAIPGTAWAKIATMPVLFILDAHV